MSLRKGDRRKKGQKHQNHTAFKAGLHCQSGKKAKDAASIVLAGLCARCREKLEWKIKYDKYKPLRNGEPWSLGLISMFAHLRFHCDTWGSDNLP